MALMDNSRLNNGEEATEASLLAESYRKYWGKDIDVYYKAEICTHPGYCVRGNPAVFDVKRRPWVLPDNGDADKLMKLINVCPTGALKYIRKQKDGEETVTTQNNNNG